jgi:sec-independent protein translocase protein TatC
MKQASLDIETAMARYMPYLMEIRKRLFFIFAVFFVAASIGFIYFQPLIKFVMRLYDLKGINIAFTSPFQFINLAIDSGISIGIIVIFPLLIYQVLSFLKPALKEKEYHLVLSLIPVSVVLFIIGFAFGSWMMKFVVSIFSQQSNQLHIQNLWDIEKFLSQIFLTALFLGILFQFPIVLSSLIRLKAVKYSTITNFRLPIYGVLVILTIMMPPTDILSDFLIFFPLAFLFESTLLFNRSFK